MTNANQPQTPESMFSLRWRLILGLFLVMGAASYGAQFAVTHLVKSGFEATERSDNLAALKRLKGVLQRQVDAFATTAKDWSIWDDLSDHLQEPNQAFFESSLSAEAYAGMGWDAVVLRLSDGTIRMAEGIDREAGKFTQLPEGLLELESLYQAAGPDDPIVSGFARLGDQPYLVASLPVLRTDGSASPAPGRLVAAKRVWGAWLDTQRVLTDLDFALMTPENAAKAFPKTTASLLNGEDALLVPESETQILGLTLIESLKGDPLFVLKLRNPRTAHAQGVLLGQTASQTVVVVGLLLSALLYIVVGRVALTPVLDLERAARALARGEARRVDYTRKDEIGRLADAFNRMARTITRRDRALRDANADMHQLLDAMDEAVLSFDLDGRVGASRSLRATELLGAGASADADIVNLLYGHLPDEAPERQAFREWLDTVREMNGDDVPFEELATLAPTKCELRGKNGTTHLKLGFRPIRRDTQETTTADDTDSPKGRLEAILLVASDETALVRKTQEAAARELALTTRIERLQERAGHEVHVLVAALDHAEALLSGVRELASATRSLDGVEAERLSLMGRAHSLKATALSYKLEDLHRIADGLERALDTDAEHGEDEAFGRLVDEGFQAIAEIRTEITRHSPIGTAVLDQTPVSRRALSRLHGLLRQLDTAAAPLHEELLVAGKLLLAVPFGQATGHLSEACARWARAEGLHVALQIHGRGELVTRALGDTLSMALGHLVRNSLAHGIEPAEERRAAHKVEQATIAIACRPSDKGPIITVEDDGRGLQREPLLAKAIATGRITAEEAAGWSDEQVWALAFEAGASSRTGVDDLAGRGVGLAEVRRALAETGYAIDVRSSVTGTCFTLRPLTNAHQAVSLLPSLPSPANDLERPSNERSA